MGTSLDVPPYIYLLIARSRLIDIVSVTFEVSAEPELEQFAVGVQ